MRRLLVGCGVLLLVGAVLVGLLAFGSQRIGDGYPIPSSDAFDGANAVLIGTVEPGQPPDRLDSTVVRVAVSDIRYTGGTGAAEAIANELTGTTTTFAVTTDDLPRSQLLAFFVRLNFEGVDQDEIPEVVFVKYVHDPATDLPATPTYDAWWRSDAKLTDGPLACLVSLAETSGATPNLDALIMAADANHSVDQSAAAQSLDDAIELCAG